MTTSYVEEKVVYFSSPGKENTDKVLEVAKAYADKYKIKHIIVASTTGYTALKATDVFKDDYNLIVVTHCTGFVKPNYQEMPENVKEELKKRGVKILTCTHAFAGVERAFRKELKIWLPVELLALALRRIFCEGVKVCLEITVMAVDAGLVPQGEDVIAIAGTGRGADTALHLKAAGSSYLFDLKVRRIICKPDTF